MKRPRREGGGNPSSRTHRASGSKIAGRALLLALFVLVVLAAHQWSLRAGINTVRETATQRLKVYVSSLEGILGKYDYLPTTIKVNKDVFRLLLDPGNPKLVAAVNHYLEEINEQAKSSAIYIIDLNGMTLASSNWNRSDSFVGVDLAFRPYVQDVLHGTPGRFYGIGTTSNEAGYYFAHGIYRDTELLGVAAVKVSLEKLEKTWTQGGEKVLLADENSVIFLSSISELKYKTLGRLQPRTLERLEYTHQYYKQTLQPVQFMGDETFADGARIVSIRYEGQSAENRDLAEPGLLTQEWISLQPGWRFMLLSDLGKVRKNASVVSAFAAVVFVLLVFVFLYLRQRQIAVMQSLAAKEALQQAYDNLEVMVEERTSELNLAMQSLKQEIAERHQAQQALQTAQNELIQAGKMAVLGQMSAGITHELSQPLTALRTMSDNARVLLERGCIEEAAQNLSIISQTVDRMGVITRQLKMFSRKSTARLAAVSVGTAVSNALFLVDRRVRVEEVRVAQSIPEGDVFALGDSIRLEQVLVNLFNNALDSMADSKDRCLGVDVRAADGRVYVRVKDCGAGISDEVREHLFEPFFTTKEQGAGLGLGLVISSQIVREFGGVLRGENAPEGGAVFTVELNEAVAEIKHA